MIDSETWQPSTVSIGRVLCYATNITTLAIQVHKMQAGWSQNFLNDVLYKACLYQHRHLMQFGGCSGSLLARSRWVVREQC